MSRKYEDLFKELERMGSRSVDLGTYKKADEQLFNANLPAQKDALGDALANPFVQGGAALGAGYFTLKLIFKVVGGVAKAIPVSIWKFVTKADLSRIQAAPTKKAALETLGEIIKRIGAENPKAINKAVLEGARKAGIRPPSPRAIESARKAAINEAASLEKNLAKYDKISKKYDEKRNQKSKKTQNSKSKTKRIDKKELDTARKTVVKALKSIGKYGPKVGQFLLKLNPAHLLLAATKSNPWMFLGSIVLEYGVAHMADLFLENMVYDTWDQEANMLSSDAATAIQYIYRQNKLPAIQPDRMTQIMYNYQRLTGTGDYHANPKSVMSPLNAIKKIVEDDGVKFILPPQNLNISEKTVLEEKEEIRDAQHRSLYLQVVQLYKANNRTIPSDKTIPNLIEEHRDNPKPIEAIAEAQTLSMKLYSEYQKELSKKDKERLEQDKDLLNDENLADVNTNLDPQNKTPENTPDSGLGKKLDQDEEQDKKKEHEDFKQELSKKIKPWMPGVSWANKFNAAIDKYIGKIGTVNPQAANQIKKLRIADVHKIADWFGKKGGPDLSRNHNGMISLLNKYHPGHTNKNHNGILKDRDMRHIMDKSKKKQVIKQKQQKALDQKTTAELLAEVQVKIARQKTAGAFTLGADSGEAIEIFNILGVQIPEMEKAYSILRTSRGKSDQLREAISILNKCAVELDKGNSAFRIDYIAIKGLDDTFNNDVEDAIESFTDHIEAVIKYVAQKNTKAASIALTQVVRKLGEAIGSLKQTYKKYSGETYKAKPRDITQGYASAIKAAGNSFPDWLYVGNNRTSGDYIYATNQGNHFQLAPSEKTKDRVKFTWTGSTWRRDAQKAK